MILTHKYRLKGKRTVRQLHRYAWMINQVWNYCVQTQRKVQANWKDGLRGKWPSHFDFTRLTTGTSKDLGVHAQSVQGVCEQFTKSRDQHKKCPGFRKSNGSSKSLGWVPFQQQSRKISGNSITYLGNTYRFFGAKRRPLPAVVKGGAFVEDALGRWWVTLHVEVSQIANDSSDVVGIDLGLKTLATLSNGDKIENPQVYRKLEGLLAVAQRAGNVSRAKVINAKIKNIRVDHLHKMSTNIAETYRTVVVGDVNSSQLAKTRMGKSVNDACWSTFRRFLCYKVSRHGGTFLEVDERGSTRVCSSCGVTPPESPKGIADLGIREWDCSGCGTHHDRDVNAAKNILTFGLSVQPLVEESRVTYGC